jgi:AbrB family looped-hinge helix DNA binding protein
MATSVTSKGQVTIPKRVRDRLAIGPGSRVEFEITPSGQVVILKVGDEHPGGRIEALRGRAGPGMTTDQIMALTRGDP